MKGQSGRLSCIVRIRLVTTLLLGLLGVKLEDVRSILSQFSSARCQLSVWGSWSVCTASCDGGVKTRPGGPSCEGVCRVVNKRQSNQHQPITKSDHRNLRATVVHCKCVNHVTNES